MLNKKFLNENKYRTAIIGAGRIGAATGTKNGGDFLTHAYAYTKHEATTLVGFYDTDPDRSKAAADRWSSTSFSSLEMLMEQAKPDIVSVCTSDEDHVSTLERILQYQPRLIICEKPVTTRLEDTDRIMLLARRKKIPILVNYSRRFDLSVEKLRQSIQAGLYGQVLMASAIYVRGALHNGSHIIDLARYLFGEAKKVVPLYARSDFSESDKSVAAYLQFEACPQFHLMVGDGRKYFVLEFDILFEKTRWRFTDKGFNYSVQGIESPPNVLPFLENSPSVHHEATQLKEAIVFLVDNAVNHLDNQEPLRCDIKDALETQRVCDKLLAI